MRYHLLAGAVLLGSVAAACGGGSKPHQTGCTSAADCAEGQVCIGSGTSGTCQAAPFGVQLTTPVQGAQIGSAGADVRAVVTKAAASAAPPSSVVLVVDGREAGDLALESDQGTTLTYHGTFVPAPNTVKSAIIAAVAKTSGGNLASLGAIVSVDSKPPVIQSATASCSPAPACVRDGVLGVTVSVADDHPVTVTVSLDLPGPSVPAPPTGAPTFHIAELRLAQYALAAFSGSATATVTAQDSFGNTATTKANAVDVTRLRWVYDAQAPGVSSPVVTSVGVLSGVLIVSVNANSAQLRAVNPDGTELWRATTGTQSITSAPSVGAFVYAGSNDGKLYVRTVSAGGPAQVCPTPAPAAGALFTPAITTTAETAFTAGAASGLYGAKAGTPVTCTAAVSTTDPVSTSPAITAGKVVVATANGVGTATLRTFASGAAGGTVTPTDGSSTCGKLDAPLAANGNTAIAACNNGHVFSIDVGTLAANRLFSLSGAALESPVLFPNNDILVGTNDRKLHRLAPPSSGTGNWIDAWNPVPDLGAAVTGAAIVSADPAGVVAYAVTSVGHLHAVDATGKTVWSTATEVTPPLGAVSLSFPAVAPAASADTLPTLYTGSADGKLYAVVVDSGLDPASPWPKSHHDLRNTGNAAAPLP